MTSTLYQDAISDAKKLREIAEQNAKNAIIESITPKIRQLIESQILGEEEGAEADIVEEALSESPIEHELTPDAIEELKEMLKPEEAQEDINENTVNESEVQKIAEINDYILSARQVVENIRNIDPSNLEGANLKKYLALVAISDRSTTKLEEMIEAARGSQLFESTVNNSKDQVQSIKKEIKEMKRSLRDLLSEEVITIELDLGEDAEVDSSEIEVKVVEEEEILDASADEEGDDEEGDEEVAVDVDVETEEEVDLSELVNEVEEDMDEMYGGNRGDDHRSGKGMHHISGGGKYGKDGHRLDYMEEDEDMDEDSYMEEEEDADEGMDHMMEGVDDDTVLEIDENMLREELAKLMQESEDSEEEEVLEETAEPVATEQNDELQAELESYQGAVADLQSQLAEMSLFNAKLLYTNKLLMNSDLSQTQRAQAIETLDDAASLREVKLLFKTLTESFSKRAEDKTSSRNIGGASRPTKSASMNLTESKETNRWALLAGIK